MNLFNFPIKRPVTIVMGMLMLVVIGMLALNRMPLDLAPEITFPNLMIMAVYEGAGPEEVEERIAKPLEAAVKTTANIKNVKVTAQEGMAFINAEFNWGTDLDTASADLREKISMVREVFPDEMEDPIILRLNLSEMPVIFLHLDDPTGRRNLADLEEITNDMVGPMIERLPGVASVAPLGGLTREIQINLDQNRMKQYGLSFTDVIQSVAYRNMDKTIGEIDSGGQSFRIVGKSQFLNIEELSNIVVGSGISKAQAQEMSLAPMIGAIAGYQNPLAGKGAISPIRLRDVADIVDSFKDPSGMVRIIVSGKEPSLGIGIAVMKETDANMVEVADTVKDALAEIGDKLPAGVGLHVSFDLSQIIVDTLNALTTSAMEGAVLAALVIFLFLWGWRPSAIVILAIPLSMLTAFICMYFADYTLNIMTLGGMVIAVGKLVDDSIVVLENIDRHLAMGEHPHKAAEEGLREVAVAVVSATLVAVIIFLPVAFTEGLSAQLFTTFAGTVFFALMGSLIVSFTVVPMMSSRMLTHHTEKSREELRARKGLRASVSYLFVRMKKAHDGLWEALQNAYGVLLGWAVDSWGKVMIIAVLIMLLTGIMATQLTYDFLPRLVGGFYESTINMPKGTVLEETDRILTRFQERITAEISDYDHFFMIIGESNDPQRAAFTGGEQGSHQATFMTVMNKWSEGRTTTDKELRELWDDLARNHPAVEISFRAAGSLEFTSEKAIQIKILGDDFDVLRRIADDIAEAIKPINGTRDVTTTMQEGVPEYVFRFDRDKLAAYGMPSAMALAEAKAAVGGQLAQLYREAGKEYDITVRLKEEQRDEFREIGDVLLASPLGFHFPLREVATFEYTSGPSKIERENSKRLARVESNKTDRPLSEIINDINKALENVSVPEGYLVEFGGEEKDRQEAFADLGMMFLAALLLVYMILASLYESIIHPITIMVAVPLAFTGSMIGMFVSGVSFGVTAFIGMIMLVGIVATNSIVLMDFIIEYHNKGMPRREAIIEAGRARLRPILMTALTTLFGVLPIALGAAEGMELMQPMGIVVVGGLFSSTPLTLLIIPVFYQIFDDFSLDMKNLFGGKQKKSSES